MLRGSWHNNGSHEIGPFRSPRAYKVIRVSSTRSESSESQMTSGCTAPATHLVRWQWRRRGVRDWSENLQQELRHPDIAPDVGQGPRLETDSRSAKNQVAQSLHPRSAQCGLQNRTTTVLVIVLGLLLKRSFVQSILRIVWRNLESAVPASAVTGGALLSLGNKKSFLVSTVTQRIRPNRPVYLIPTLVRLLFMP